MQSNGGPGCERGLHKAKPFIIFMGAKRETEAMKKEFQHKCIVATSPNGWMDTDLTLMWVNSDWGSFPVVVAYWLGIRMGAI